jgi:hypothetical protein
MAKALAKKKTAPKNEQPVITPEVIGEAEVEEFDTPTPVASMPIDNSISAYDKKYAVKLDTKRIDGRSFHQVMSLIEGSLGGVKKIVIEEE